MNSFIDLSMPVIKSVALAILAVLIGLKVIH